MRKSNRVRIHDEKEQWGEISPKKKERTLRDLKIRKSDGVRVHQEK